MSRARTRNGIPATFGKGSSFVGDLVCNRSIVVYGTYRGSIASGGTILLERRSTIEADSLKATRLIVAGSLNARHVDAQLLELHPSARFYADARVRSLRCEAGAGVMGRISIVGGESTSRSHDSGQIERDTSSAPR